MRESIPSRELSDKSVFFQVPLVSVHMVTYNHEPYIAKSIDGVLQQETDFPFELIIGEDCSSDKTREIVLEYQKNFPAIIRVLISDCNVGAHKNYQRVYAACRGKYIAYCEGDDFWHHPLKLKKQAKYLELHPDVGLIHSDVDWHYVETKETKHNFYRKHSTATSSKAGQSLLHDIITSEYVVTTCSVMVRALILKEILAECQEELSDKYLMGDTQTWVEFVHRTKLAYLNESLATYNVLPESACHSKNFDKYYFFLNSAYEMRFHYAKKYGGLESIKIQNMLVGNRINNLLLFAYRYRLPYLAKEARQLAEMNNFNFLNFKFLYYYGAQNKLLHHIVWLMTLPFRIYNRINRKFQK